MDKHNYSDSKQTIIMVVDDITQYNSPILSYYLCNLPTGPTGQAFTIIHQ